MADMCIRNLLTITKKTQHCNLFFLLFFFINLHKSATANLVNLQSDKTSHTTVKESYNSQKHDSFVDFLSQKLTTHCNKCVKIVNGRISQLEYCHKKKQTSANAIRSITKLSKIITNFIDKFRISLNNDFKTWYNKYGIQDQDSQLFYQNDLYNLCTIYNFTMLCAYKKQQEAAKKLLKNKKYNNEKDIKYDAYQMVIKDFARITHTTLQNIALLNIRGCNDPKINAENGYLSSIVNKEHRNKNNSIDCTESTFTDEKTQTKKTLKSLTKFNIYKLMAAFKIIKNQKKAIKQKNRQNKKLDIFFERLKSILDKFEISYILFQIYKQKITKDDTEGNIHFIDKFSCFYLTIKSFIVNLETYKVKCENTIFNDSATMLDQHNAYLYFIKTNIFMIYNYIRYTTKNALYLEKDSMYIDQHGNLIKKKTKKVIYNDLDNYLYVFAVCPKDAKTLKAKRSLHHQDTKNTTKRLHEKEETLSNNEEQKQKKPKIK
ncbi:hypothetical protein BDAP_001251 [Binucleata daphniae]